MGIVENSFAGFSAAIRGGFGIEADLQLSSDGEAMVFHDFDLKRMTAKTDHVRMLTAAELRATKLMNSADTIPDLTELLELVNGKVPLLIELKDQDGGFGPNTGQLEQRTADILRNYKGEVAVMSFNPHSVMKMAEYAPDTPRGLTTSGFTSQNWSTLFSDRRKELLEISDFDRTRSSFISHKHTLLDSTPVSKLRANGVPILCWTVKSAKQEAAARRLADNIIFEGYIPSKYTQIENAHV